MSLFSRHVGRHWNTFHKVYKIRNTGNCLCHATNSVGTKKKSNNVYPGSALLSSDNMIHQSIYIIPF